MKSTYHQHRHRGEETEASCYNIYVKIDKLSSGLSAYDLPGNTWMMTGSPYP